MKEKAILIGIITPDVSKEQAHEYLDELAFLAKTAGAKPIKNFTQKLLHYISNYEYNRSKRKDFLTL